MDMCGETTIMAVSKIGLYSMHEGEKRAHTLEFITEAAQELYAKGQLHVKPYAGYLKGKRMQSHTQDSPL